MWMQTEILQVCFRVHAVRLVKASLTALYLVISVKFLPCIKVYFYLEW